MAARKKADVPVDPARDAEYDRALELLRDLVDWSAVDQQYPVRGNAVYTTGVVWCGVVWCCGCWSRSG